MTSYIVVRAADAHRQELLAAARSSSAGSRRVRGAITIRSTARGYPHLGQVRNPGSHAGTFTPSGSTDAVRPTDELLARIVHGDRRVDRRVEARKCLSCRGYLDLRRLKILQREGTP